MLFCFVAMIHIPNVIAAPHSRIAWTIVARDSAFGAGAVLLAIASGGRERSRGENHAAIGALCVIASASLLFGMESLVHPECVPAVPLVKVTPLWIPAAHFWTVITGIALVMGAGVMLVRSVSRQSAAALGDWVVLLVVSIYLAIMVAKPNIEDLNYFADTLMFGGVLLIASRAYDVRRESRISPAPGQRGNYQYIFMASWISRGSFAPKRSVVILPNVLLLVKSR